MFIGVKKESASQSEKDKGCIRSVGRDVLLSYGKRIIRLWTSGDDNKFDFIVNFQRRERRKPAVGPRVYIMCWMDILARVTRRAAEGTQH